MEKKNVKILLDVGLPRNLKGFDYIVDAISIIDRDGLSDMKWVALYYEIGKKYDRSDKQVERSIRYALWCIRDKPADYDIAEKYFGFVNCTNAATLSYLYTKCKEEENLEEDQNKVKNNDYGDIEFLVRKEIIRVLKDLRCENIS